METRTKVSTLWGMIIYQLIGDGCLNGSWTNSTKKRGIVLNEIARKEGKSRNGSIEGRYYVSWIDQDEEPTVGELYISKNGMAYSLKWIVDGVTVFNGVGMRIGDNQLAVTYWDGNSICFP